MVQSANNRTNKYTTKLDGSVQKNRFDAQRDNMIKKQSTSIKELVEIEVKVKAICHDVSVIELPYFIIFGKECLKLSKIHIADTLEDELLIVGQKWISRGLNDDTLAKIARLVYPDFEKTPTSCNYEASYSPLTNAGTNYDDKFLYAETTDGTYINVLADGEIITFATGDNDFDYALISVTGGVWSGEKITLVGDQDNFLGLADVQTWCNNNVNIGVGNFVVDIQFMGGFSNIGNQGACNNYNYGICGVCSYAPTATDPGYLRTT